MLSRLEEPSSPSSKDWFKRQDATVGSAYLLLGHITLLQPSRLYARLVDAMRTRVGSRTEARLSRSRTASTFQVSLTHDDLSDESKRVAVPLPPLDACPWPTSCYLHNRHSDPNAQLYTTTQSRLQSYPSAISTPAFPQVSFAWLFHQMVPKRFTCDIVESLGMQLRQCCAPTGPSFACITGTSSRSGTLLQQSGAMTNISAVLHKTSATSCSDR